MTKSSERTVDKLEGHIEALGNGKEQFEAECKKEAKVQLELLRPKIEQAVREAVQRAFAEIWRKYKIIIEPKDATSTEN